MEIAYTIGNQRGYDRDLTAPDVVAGERKVSKLGQRLDEDPPYPGGWVWRTQDEAQAFVDNTELSFPAKVYGVRLPESWAQDVSPEPDPEDGVRRLLHDAELLLLEGS